MASKKVEARLNALNRELNTLNWDPPPLRRYRLRSRVVNGAPHPTTRAKDADPRPADNEHLAITEQEPER